MAKKDNIEMPFLDHLEELRTRLIWILGALIIGVGLGFYLVYHFDVVTLLEQPVRDVLGSQKLVATGVTARFQVLMTASLAIGIVLAFPVILYQIWSFLSPGLHKHEKRIAIPVLAAATLLFLIGASLAYFWIVPFTLRFLLLLPVGDAVSLITIQEYFSFLVSLCLALGAVFELPIVIVALTALGIVTPTMLNRFRRYAIVVCYAAAAIITPGDIFVSTALLFLVLYLLFEVSVVASYFVYRRKQRRRARADAEAAAAESPA